MRIGRRLEEFEQPSMVGWLCICRAQTASHVAVKDVDYVTSPVSQACTFQEKHGRHV